jgi:hypothetical protein
MPKGFRKQEQETAAAYSAAGLPAANEQAKQEAQAMAETRKRGQPVFRVSVGFTPDVYEYINTMAHVDNTSLTGYLIKLLAKDRERNEEIYQAYKALQEKKAAQEQEGGRE